MDDKKYIKYFNYGYFLSKHEPQVLEKLLKATPEKDEILQPLQAGRDEYKKEKLNERIQRISDKSKKKDKGLER